MQVLEGLHSKQSLLTVNTCEVGTWGALLSWWPPSPSACLPVTSC